MNRNGLSPYTSLRRLFEENIHVNHISEQLASFDREESPESIREYMRLTEYDVVGIRESGIVTGYMEAETDRVIPFQPKDLVSEAMPLIQLLYLFKEKKRVFVLEGNAVTRLVTFADLQKPPVRMLLFGLISLIETYLLQMIQAHYPESSWMHKISPSRLQAAENLFTQRKCRNEQIHLIDCLQLSDKKTLIVKHEALRTLLQFPSRGAADRFFNQLEALRNKLAHAQDLTAGSDWGEIIEVMEVCERILEISEANS